MADVNGVLKGIIGACAHNWVSNGGRGGDPDFRPNRQMSREPLMHVMCSACKCRTWFTEAQWNALPREADGASDKNNKKVNGQKREEG